MRTHHFRYIITNRILLLMCFSMISIGSLFSQISIGKQKTDSIFKYTPAFSIYKDNYFITGTSLGEEPTKNNSDIKFQFSFKVRMQNKLVVWNSYLYLIYTQKSFWNVYQDSSPFEETNYNPGLMLAKPIYKNNTLRSMLMLSIEHESNGRDSIYSRSWNYIGINYSHHFSPKTSASLKFCIPFGLSDNSDLMTYVGFTEAQFTWEIKKNKLVLDVLGKKGAAWSTKGSLITTLSFRPSTRRNLYWSLQWFVGYAESLIDYKQSTNMVRLGITIKPSFFRFY